MSEGKIMMRVLRDITFNPINDMPMYRATIRIYLRMPGGGEKDLTSLININAVSTETLEAKIDKIKQSYEELLKTHPEFLNKVRVPEEREISEPK